MARQIDHSPDDDTTDGPRSTDVFSVARGHLNTANAARERILEAWTELGAADPWDLRVSAADDATWTITCTVQWPDEVADRAERAAAAFVAHVKAAFDTALHACAATVCAALWEPPRGVHTMVFVETAAEFAALREEGMWAGLRPDQVRILERFQPFTDGSDMATEIAVLLTHLRNLLDAPYSGDTSTRARRRVAVWAADAHPLAWAGDEPVQKFDGPYDGVMDPTHTVATFEVPADCAGRSVTANPQVGFDAIFNADPLPRSHEDNLDRRSRGLLRVTAMFVEALERSVSTVPLAGGQTLAELLPAEPDSPWLPVHFDDDADRTDAIEGLARSPLGLASFRDDEGTFVLLRLSSDLMDSSDPDDQVHVMGREIPQATIIDVAERFGTATENAALEPAWSWGLPDFVYPPVPRTKGSGVREIGDGTIVSAGRGIALQVKGRERPSDDSAKEARWIQKRAQDGANQASGTLRLFLNRPRVELANQRGRKVDFDGTAIAWVAVVIIDHPNPPSGLVAEVETRVPTVVVLRRDWEFVWNQLRSASAVVDYFHRVAADDDPAPLGDEPLRYLELAQADLEAEPGVSRWAERAGIRSAHGPLLPMEPAATGDTAGHEVFRQILDDIARTDFNGPEGARVDILARLDRYSVGDRADLGRTLISWMDECLLTPADQTRWQHRTIILEQGGLHLAFSVCSTLTGYHADIHRSWLLLRRHQFLAHVNADTGSSLSEDELPWTVGVLLTPRPDGTRLWDTSIAATNSAPTMTAEEQATLTATFGGLGTQGNLPS